MVRYTVCRAGDRGAKRGATYGGILLSPSDEQRMNRCLVEEGEGNTGVQKREAERLNRGRTHSLTISKRCKSECYPVIYSRSYGYITKQLSYVSHSGTDAVGWYPPHPPTPSQRKTCTGHDFAQFHNLSNISSN